MEIYVLVGLLVPVVFFAFTGIVKSLIGDFCWANFYLGIDIALAALANAIVNVLDLMKKLEESTAGAVEVQHLVARQVGNTVICLIVSFGALLITMALHRRFDLPEEANGNRRWRRGILLGIVGNLAGGLVMMLFIYWKVRRLV